MFINSLQALCFSLILFFLTLFFFFLDAAFNNLRAFSLQSPTLCAAPQGKQATLSTSLFLYLVSSHNIRQRASDRHYYVRLNVVGRPPLGCDQSTPQALQQRDDEQRLRKRRSSFSSSSPQVLSYTSNQSVRVGCVFLLVARSRCIGRLNCGELSCFRFHRANERFCATRGASAAAHCCRMPSRDARYRPLHVFKLQLGLTTMQHYRLGNKSVLIVSKNYFPYKHTPDCKDN